MKKGVLVVNLGTPAQPQTKEVRRYLRQFLADPRVIDVPAWARFLLLYLFILPFRPQKSAQAYRKIWLAEGSPLLVYTKRFTEKLASRLAEKDMLCTFAMRYQEPNMQDAVQDLYDSGAESITLLPMFPQYSSSASGSAVENFFSTVSKQWDLRPTKVLPPFYRHPQFIACLVSSIQEFMNTSSHTYDALLLSYHGLPVRHVEKCDLSGNYCSKNPQCCEQENQFNHSCYRRQCLETSRLIEESLNLTIPVFSAFQSRLGRAEWIKPYTDQVILELPQKGISSVLVACPSFTADCLETVEEIGIRAKEDFVGAGGEQLDLVPCLNDRDDWVEVVASWCEA